MKRLGSVTATQAGDMAGRTPARTRRDGNAVQIATLPADGEVTPGSQGIRSRGLLGRSPGGAARGRDIASALQHRDHLQ